MHFNKGACDVRGVKTSFPFQIVVSSHQQLLSLLKKSPSWHEEMCNAIHSPRVPKLHYYLAQSLSPRFRIPKMFA